MSARFLVAAAAVAALMTLGTPVAAQQSDADVVRLIAELGLVEGATPVRERKDWRIPKKIVMLGGAPPQYLQSMQALAPTTKFVSVNNLADAAREAADADVVMGLTNPGICAPEILEKARDLRWIFSMSAGVEQCMAVPSVHSRDLLVTSLRAIDSSVIGEHAIALAMAMARGLDTFVINTTKARWSREDSAATRMQSLTGKTLLVVGLGGIGTEVAKRGHGIGMKVVAVRNSGRTGPDYVSYVGLPDELLKLAGTADVVINTAPLTTETAGVFNAKFFSAMKPSGYFINVARGGSVVTNDLLKALNDGTIAGAGLDVVDPEPLPAEHPLWSARNIIITPHVSSGSDVPRQQRWIFARENLRRYVAGEKMLSVVDLKRGY